ncbi:MAG: AI-2E family transporter [Candidatus Paceibacterota bacterium]|jgi:predicted PurR-regulated permease PerM
MSEKEKPQLFAISNGTIIRVILFGLLLVSLYVLREIVLIVLTSIVIASFIERASRRLARYGIDRTLSVFLMYFASFSVIITIFYFFTPILIIEMSNLATAMSAYFPGLDSFGVLSSETITGAKELASNLSHNSITNIASYARAIASGASAGFLEMLSLAFGGIVNFVLIVVISFYLSIQEKGIEKFLRIVTPRKEEDYVINLWDRSQRKIALWIQGQLLLGILVGVLVFLGLSILGVHYALLLAVIAALSELIPFGIILAAIPAIAFAYSEGGVSLMLLVSGFYVIVQQFENYLIAPLVVKKVVGISPLVVIISVIVGAELAGFWGLILAIPIVVPILEFSDDVEKRKSFLSTT